MADKRISELTAASTVGASDLLVLVQGGNTLKIPVSTFLTSFPQVPKIVEATEAQTTGTLTALSTTILVSKITINTGVTYALGSGTHGQEKIIVANVRTAGTSTVTVTGLLGFTTLTFSAVGQTVHLKYIDGAWYVLSNFGATVS